MGRFNFNFDYSQSSAIRADDIEAGGSFLTCQLLQTLPKVYEKSYAALWSLEGDMAIPVAGDLEGYTESVEEFRYEAKGEAKEYVDHTSDIPVLKSAYAADTFNVHTFAVATEYSLQELASFVVQPQKMAKDLSNIDRTLRQEIHELLVFGEPRRGSAGLYSDPLVPVDSGAYDPAGGGETWQSHIDFFGTVIADIEDNNELTTTIGMIDVPNKLYSLLTRTRQVGDSSMSVMAALRQDYPNLRFRKTNETRAVNLERYGVKPVGTNEDRIVFHPVNDNNQVDRLTDAPMSMPSQWKDLTYRTVFVRRSSQTIIHQPKSFLYYDIPGF